VPRGFLTEGRAWGERALALRDRSPTPHRALSLAITSALSYYQGDLHRARALAYEGLDQSRQTGHTFGEGISTMVLAWVAASEGRFGEAEAYATDTLTHYRTAGNATWAGFALNTLGTIAYQRGDLDRAAIRFEEAHHAICTVDNTYGIGFVLSNLAKVARDQGEYTSAAALYAESLALRYQQGEKQSMAGGLRGLASIASMTRQHDRAARLWGAAEALREAIGAPATHPGARARQAIEKTRRELGDEAFAAAWAAGRALTLDEAVSEAVHPPADTAGRGESKMLTALSGQYGLTPREVEVLRLIADGRSNPEIADTLCITKRTAQTHVQHILDKLDVGTRTGAATLAMRHGLLQ
jgi:non-specific serine/threonine protein kinase